MNKRIAKKKYKQALLNMKTLRNTGVAVSIINQISIDKDGKPCDAMEKGSRLIILKRPKIQYMKSANFQS